MSGTSVIPTPTPTPTIVVPSETPTPTIDPTANWQTYVDSVGKYEIKYPTNATLSTNSKPIVDIVYIGQAQIDSGRTQSELSDGYKISINFEYTAPTQTLASAANYVHQHNADNCPEPGKAVISPLIQTTISDEPAMQFSTKNCFTDSTTVMVIKGDKLYEITSMYPASNPDQQKNYQDQTVKILSTFKFTGTNNAKYTCPTNGWVDCMPVLDAAKTIACSTEAMAWYKTNCPNFQGAAL
ncbi:MAG TPA: hypothetical protein PLI45_03200 [Candidatus Woesebacteria bacterium]|nr:hypothetical protein [Candidatus Woesebacteria bacterium]